MTDAVILPGPDETAADAERGFAEKDFGFWLYLMSDAVVFALLFATYAAMRRNTAGGPTGHDVFNLSHSFAETMLLLASSTTFGLASVAIAAGQRWRALAWLGLTFLLGLGFVAMEIAEFRSLVAAGAGPQTSGFLSAFFTLVGAHGLHVSIGLAWIALLGGEAALRGLNPHVVSRLHRLGLFWHFLDIVWVGIFSVVYLPGVF